MSKLPRGFGLWPENMQIMWISQNRAKELASHATATLELVAKRHLQRQEQRDKKKGKGK